MVSLSAIDFVKSEYLDSIYYADLFRINTKIWMIMGHGKSDAARIASSKIQDNDIARDGVAIKELDSQVYGRFDLGAIGKNTNKDSSLYLFHKIDIIAYCLSDAETQILFEGSERKIVPSSADRMAELSVMHQYPASLLAVCFPDDYITYSDPENRKYRFLEIMKSTQFTKFVLIPFMPSVEEKATLYAAYSN